MEKSSNSSDSSKSSDVTTIVAVESSTNGRAPCSHQSIVTLSWKFKGSGRSEVINQFIYFLSRRPVVLLVGFGGSIGGSVRYVFRLSFDSILGLLGVFVLVHGFGFFALLLLLLSRIIYGFCGYFNFLWILLKVQNLTA